MPIYLVIQEDGTIRKESVDFDGCPNCGCDKGIERPEAREIRVYRRSSPPWPSQFELDCRQCGYLGDPKGNLDSPN